MAYDATDFVVATPITTARENMMRLRDFLRTLPRNRFNMEREGDEMDAENGECGSPACIGGWARAIFRHRTDDINEMGPLIGLSENDTWSLFWPGVSLTSSGGRAYDASPQEAANVLDHYLASGEIDWSVA